MNNTTIEFNIETMIEGSFSVQVFRDGKERLSLPRTKNLICRGMLDSLKTLGDRLHVGTGGTTPTFNDTSLQSFLAFSPLATWLAQTDVLNGTDQEREAKAVFTFTLGSVVGNIAELGVASSSTEIADIHTRALFKDGAGDPTTITMTAQDQLVVTYFVKKTISMVPVTSSIVATVAGLPVTIDYTIRPCISSSGDGGSDAFYPSSVYLTTNNLHMTVANTNRISVAAVTFIPSFLTTAGDNSPIGSNVVSLTAAGNQVIHTSVMPIGDGNFQWVCATFSTTAVSTSLNNIMFQIEFDGPNYITKANTDNVTFKFKELNNQVIV